MPRDAGFTELPILRDEGFNPVRGDLRLEGYGKRNQERYESISDNLDKPGYISIKDWPLLREVMERAEDEDVKPVKEHVERTIALISLMGNARDDEPKRELLAEALVLEDGYLDLLAVGYFLWITEIEGEVKGDTIWSEVD